MKVLQAKNAIYGILIMLTCMFEVSQFANAKFPSLQSSEKDTAKQDYSKMQSYKQQLQQKYRQNITSWQQTLGQLDEISKSLSKILVDTGIPTRSKQFRDLKRKIDDFQTNVTNTIKQMNSKMANNKAFNESQFKFQSKKLQEILSDMELANRKYRRVASIQKDTQPVIEPTFARNLTQRVKQIESKKDDQNGRAANDNSSNSNEKVYQKSDNINGTYYYNFNPSHESAKADQFVDPIFYRPKVNRQFNQDLMSPNYQQGELNQYESNSNNKSRLVHEVDYQKRLDKIQRLLDKFRRILNEKPEEYQYQNLKNNNQFGRKNYFNPTQQKFLSPHRLPSYNENDNNDSKMILTSSQGNIREIQHIQEFKDDVPINNTIIKRTWVLPEVGFGEAAKEPILVEEQVLNGLTNEQVTAAVTSEASPEKVNNQHSNYQKQIEQIRSQISSLKKELDQEDITNRFAQVGQI